MATLYFLYFFSMILPVLLWIASSIWMILDAEKIPSEAWAEVRESKTVWIAISVLLAWPFGLAFYIFLVRRPIEKIMSRQRDEELVDKATERLREENAQKEKDRNAVNDSVNDDEDELHDYYEDDNLTDEEYVGYDYDGDYDYDDRTYPKESKRYYSEDSHSPSSNLRRVMDDYNRDPLVPSYDRNQERDNFSNFEENLLKNEHHETETISHTFEDTETKVHPVYSDPVVYPAPSESDKKSHSQEITIPPVPDYAPTVHEETVDNDDQKESSPVESNVESTEVIEVVKDSETERKVIIPPMPKNPPTIGVGTPPPPPTSTTDSDKN